MSKPIFICRLDGMVLIDGAYLIVSFDPSFFLLAIDTTIICFSCIPKSSWKVCSGPLDHYFDRAVLFYIQLYDLFMYFDINLAAHAHLQDMSYAVSCHFILLMVSAVQNF